ncbi:hypothetical protein CO665_08745 [Rhizobium anhuiense]|nr:hypothetical protein CO665_08745 [Rhizobium anhuiense]
MIGAAPTRRALERFSFSRKRRTALTFCFYTIPDGKPLRTFPGIALDSVREPAAESMRHA